MRLRRTHAISVLALVLGACSRGASGTASLPDDLKKDLAAVSTTSDLALSSSTMPRLQVVSAVERNQGGTPARASTHTRQPVPPTRHRPVTHAPARTSSPVTVASADQPAESPAPVSAPSSEPAPVERPSDDGAGRVGRGAGRQGGGMGGGGILGGILGSVLGGGGMGGDHHRGHGHHGDGDGDRDGDRDRRGASRGGYGLPLGA